MGQTKGEHGWGVGCLGRDPGPAPGGLCDLCPHLLMSVLLSVKWVGTDDVRGHASTDELMFRLGGEWQQARWHLPSSLPPPLCRRAAADPINWDSVQEPSSVTQEKDPTLQMQSQRAREEQGLT